MLLPWGQQPTCSLPTICSSAVPHSLVCVTAEAPVEHTVELLVSHCSLLTVVNWDAGKGLCAFLSTVVTDDPLITPLIVLCVTVPSLSRTILISIFFTFSHGMEWVRASLNWHCLGPCDWLKPLQTLVSWDYLKAWRQRRLCRKRGERSPSFQMTSSQCILLICKLYSGSYAPQVKRIHILSTGEISL